MRTLRKRAVRRAAINTVEKLILNSIERNIEYLLDIGMELTDETITSILADMLKADIDNPIAYAMYRFNYYVPDLVMDYIEVSVSSKDDGSINLEVTYNWRDNNAFCYGKGVLQ